MFADGIRKLTIVLALALFVAGCMGQPVYNVNSRAFSASPTASLRDIEKSIKNAVTGLGWLIKSQGPGKLEAKFTMPDRGHSAIVDIAYDAKTYSINYKSSKFLRYTGTRIHTNYNLWVKRLSREIDQNLSRL